ncbi:glycosyltransferase [Vagococcus lutrae]|uniref:glycosyltransferase n=1 Tax=Vagococcus lutrae TaxID=81947 RepID=UPI0020970C18|nr:glycosyltransferase [Vagococcus lutrae]MCO7150882.1 glycosyltransferase [Vagococcus lutrae]
MTYRNQIDLSIVIPAYNAEKHIKDTVCSVLDQITKYRYEVIIINDGSTDNTLEIIYKEFGKIDNIIILSKHNSGVAETRNVGIKKAKGNYIYFLDSDDLLKSNMIENLLTEAYKNELDALMFSATSFYDEDYDGEWKPPSYLRKEYKILSGNNLLEKQQNDKNVIVSPVLYIIKKELLIRNGLFFPEGVDNEDNYFTFYLFSICKRISTTSESYYYRRVRNDSIMTSSNNKDLFRNYSRILILIMDDIPQYPTIDERIENNYLFSIFYLIVVYYFRMNEIDKELDRKLFHKLEIRMKKKSLIKYYKIHLKYFVRRLLKGI